jgi:hypothetical protein
MSFKRLDTEDISISAESVVAPAWSNQQTTLNSFFTSSTQVNVESGKYYYDVYQTGSTDAAASVQFSVAYGNYNGSGSLPVTTIPGASPSSINYGQYRTLINGDENTNFTFGTATPKSIFIISVNRSKYKEKLLPGSFNLTLSGSGNTSLKLTDNSKSTTTISYVDAGRVYDIVSGSDGTPYTTTGFSPNSGSYGKFLPDVGTIILNGDALSGSAAAGGLGLTINESSSISPSINLTSI